MEIHELFDKTFNNHFKGAGRTTRKQTTKKIRKIIEQKGMYFSINNEKPLTIKKEQKRYFEAEDYNE